MLFEIGFDLDRPDERRGDDLGGFECSGQRTGKHHVDNRPLRVEAIAQAHGLADTEWGQPGARPFTPDDLLHGDVRFTVANEDDLRGTQHGHPR